MKPAVRLCRHWLMAGWVLMGLVPANHAAAAGCFSAPAGLVGWWPGDGSVNDIAGANNGTLQGGATAGGAGVVGSALTFDGTNGYVQIPDSAVLRPTNLTVEAWVWFNSLDSPTSGNSPVGQQYLVFKESTHPQAFEGYALTKARVAGRDVFDIQVSSATGQSVELTGQTLVVTGAWYHVAGVRGSNYLQLYVNGQLESQTNVSFPQDYGNYPLYFGTSGQPTWDHKLAGALDEVSLYNRALSSNQIAAIYAARADGKCKGVAITAQPQSQTVALGSNVTFSVTVSGSLPLFYQWQRDGVNLTNGSNVSGAFAPVLSLANVSSNDSANYRVIITNSVSVTTSAVAVLTVVPSLAPPGITNQPASQMAAVGTDATFTVGISGTGPFGYQWRFGSTNLADGGQFNGTTSSTLAINYLLAGNSGGYSVVVTNELGVVTSMVATLTVTLSTGCLPAPSGLVGWWPGDGSARDIAGANNGTLQGGATAGGAGAVGSAFTFDGTNGYVQIPDSAVLRPTNLTVEAWVLFSSLDSAGTAPAGRQYVVFKQNTRSSYFEGYDLGKMRVAGGDVLAFIVSSPSAPASDQTAILHSTTFVTPGVWYHVAGVRGSNYTELYVNGQLEGRTNAAFTQDYGNFPLYFGTSGETYWDGKFRGLLDEVSLYNRALSSNEIAAVYAAGAAGKCKAPAITAQPQSQAVVVGTSALFTVTATGLGSLSYQWQFNGGNIAGATSTQLALNNVQPTNAGNYTVVVTNLLGSAISDVATLTVWVPPAITTQPLSRTNILGTDASFSVTASGTPPPAYQWQFNRAAISGATGNVLLRSAVSFSDAGSYQVVLTNVAGMVTSTVSTLTVVCPSVVVGPATLPSGLVGNPYNQNLTASGGLGPYTFAVTAGSLPAGLGLSSAGVLNGMPAAIGTNSFTVTATDTNGCPGSQVCTLAVTGEPPAISLQPQSRTNTLGTDASFSVTASGTPLPACQWQFNGAVIPGATGYNLVRSAVSFADAGGYRVVLTNVAGAVTSTVATLTVVCPSVTVAPATLPNGVADSPYNQSLSASGGRGPYTFGLTAGTLPAGLSLSGAGVLSGTLAAIATNSFTVAATDTNGCSGSQAYTLAVTGAPPVITLQPQSRTNVASTAATFTATATGTSPLSYQWQFNEVNLTDNGLISGAKSSILEITLVQPSDAGSYTLVLTNVAGVVTSAVATLTVTLPPAVHVPPASRTVAAGSNVTFSVTASGTQPLSYQWQFNGAAIAEATGVNLLLNNAQLTNAGSYTVVVTNVAGSVTSAVAVLTVLVPPAITVQPQSRTNVAGTTATFGVTATGTGPLNYQWQLGEAALANDGRISGATTDTLQIAGAQAGDAGNYTVVVSNAVGVVTSAVASLTMTVPPAITVPPASLSAVAGTNVSFSVTASGTQPLSYQWQFNGATIAGATGVKLILSNVQLTNAGSYAVVVTNVAGSVTSAVAALTVLVPPTITVQPQNRTNVAGTTATFSVTATGTGPLNYQWQLGGAALVNDGRISGATTDTLQIAGAQAGDAGNYTVVVSNAVDVVTSAVASLTVTVPPAITLPPASLSAVAGTNVSFSVTASGTQPLSYQWQFNGADIGGAAGTSLLLTNVQPTNAGSYTVVVTNMAGSVTSAVASLTVTVPPAITVQPASLSAVAGTNVSFSVTASGTQPLSYQWQFNGAGMPGATGTNLLLTNVQPTNAGNYTVVVSNTAGVVTSAVASLTVSLPLVITGQPASQQSVAGMNVAFLVTASGTGPLRYQWLFNGTNLYDGGQFSGATAATLSVSNVQPANAGNYAVVVTNLVGSVTSAVATLTVVPAAACVSAATGLVGWWPAEGDANDIAGTNSGTLQVGATASAVGLVGSAFSFDGTNAYVRIPDSPTLRPTNLTVEAWVWFSSLDSPTSGNSPVGQQYLVFKESTHPQAFEGYALMKARVAGRDVFDIQVSSATGQSVELTGQTLVVTGAWYHVAGVRGPNFLQLYVNGQLESQTNVSFAQDYGNYPLYFGTSGQPTWDHKLAGRLDEVSLYNSALSSNQIAAIYTARADGKCKGVAITAQPQSQTAALGSNVTFSVTASGSLPLLYQWQRGGVNLTNGSNVSGALSPVLSLANVSVNDSANYRVFITNIVSATTSTVAVLTVAPTLAPAVITNQPASQTAAVGTNVTFTVGVSGTGPFGYQWRFSGTNLAGGGQFSGTTSSTLAINYLLPTNSGGYSVVVTNELGAVTSMVATLTVTLPAGCLPAPSGLVGWWPGDGSTRDIVGTNNGMLQGNAVANAAGLNGQAFSFDGTNGFMQIPDSPVFHPTNLSVECWVRFAAYQTPGTTYYSNQQYIVFKQNSRSAEFEGFALTKDHDPQGDVFLWEVASASGELIRIDSVSTVVTGVWYHVVGVRGPDYVQLYKDGQLEVQTNVNFPQDYGNTPLYIGTSGQSYYDRRLHADLDEVSLYNRALSAGEIAALYAAGAAGKCKGTNGLIIAGQPQSQTVAPGSNAIFSVSATGIAPLTYQWQFNGAAIPDATGTNLTLTSVQATNSGNYRVVVNNPAGSVISAVAVLTVTVPLVVTLPPTNQTILAGGTVDFSVAATGTPPLNYQWQWDGTNLAGAVSQTLSLTNVQSSQVGSYNVVVSDAAGSATSAVATLTVLVPPEISKQPTNQTVLVGGTANFSAAATGTEPMSYQWLFNGASLDSAVSQTLSLTNVQPAQAGEYSLMVTNSAGSATSAVAVLTVASPPLLLNARTTANGTFTFTLSGAAGLSYVIEVSTDLQEWTSLTSVTGIAGQAYFTDTTTSNSVSRFYRARLSY